MGKAARKHREGFVMTETKYIFPKQPQSVAVLAFIAVLLFVLSRRKFYDLLNNTDGEDFLAYY